MNQASEFNSNPLLRQSGESARAHKTFLDYWQMGDDRSLAKLRQLHATQSSDERKPAMNTIKVWAQRHHWTARVKEADHLVAIERIEQAKLHQLEKIEIFRQHCEDSGIELVATCERMLQLISARLKDLESNKLNPQDLPAFIRASSAALEVGIELRARALGIEKLMDSFGNQKAQFIAGLHAI